MARYFLTHQKEVEDILLQIKETLFKDQNQIQK
jgi:hypothetical protein